MAIDIEAQTLQNTADIGKLTGTVAELATMFRYEGERMKEDRSDVKAMIAEMRSLGAKIGGFTDMQTAFAQVQTRVDQLKEWKDKYDLSRMDSRIGALEKVGQEEAGAARALSTGADWFWRLFGPAVSALVMAIGAWYFSHQPYYTSSSSTTTTHGVSGAITGE